MEVREALGLGTLRDYTTGGERGSRALRLASLASLLVRVGTVHLIINNQIGFTTTPDKSRSSPYSSDLGKAFDAPIFHINGDDPEAVARAFELATEYRQRYHSDVVIDMIGYRRHGHNEIDQPRFTQPLMYKAIEAQPTTLNVYVYHSLHRVWPSYPIPHLLTYCLVSAQLQGTSFVKQEALARGN